MGVLIAWRGLARADCGAITSLFHSAPLVEAVEQMLGSRYACVSSSDCIYVTGSTFQSRVHRVYVLSPRHCAGKPVYRQRGPEGLFPYSPAHENQ